jgi:hypothetical protein
LTRAAHERTIRMPAKRAMEYRTKLLGLSGCLGGSDDAGTLVKANALLNETINDRPLLDAGWELHDIVGLERSQKTVQTGGDGGPGPIFVLIVFRRIRKEVQQEPS